MDETVVSKFRTRYFVRALCGAIFFSTLGGWWLFLGLFGNLKDPAYACFKAAIFLAALGGYFYFFSKSWKRIRVTPEAIAVYDVVFRRQITIPYTDITRVGTYRKPGYNRWGHGYAQDFVIEFGDDKSVSFNEAWYDNYDRLTMAIYLHKYGPGHGRERYLAHRDR